MILYIKTIALKNDASSKMINFQRALFFKRAFLKMKTFNLFPILSIIVFVIIYSHI